LRYQNARFAVVRAGRFILWQLYKAIATGCLLFPIFETRTSQFILDFAMKKLLILALGAATLGLGACSRRSTCPAYTTSTQSHAAPVTASTATPIVSQ
jgi:hypothetical protein